MTPKPPFLKGKGFNPMPIVRGGIPRFADSANFPKVIGTPEWEAYWIEQIYYCKNGYQTGGIFLPGRYYYYLNFNHMATVNGIITPDMVDLHLEMSYIIDYVVNHGLDFICAKKRRAGVSEFFQKAKIDYDYRFNPGFKSGIAAGQEEYVKDFMQKWNDGEKGLPPELRLKKLKDNKDEVIAGYQFKADDGDMRKGGSGSTIYLATMFKNPALFKGKFLNTAVGEECGEFENLKKFKTATDACLKDGSIKKGSMFLYGCVCAGTKVWDNKGNLINIENLVQENGILGFSGTGISKEGISWIKPPAKKPCYRITTSGGNVLECSEDHPLMWTKRMWVNKDRVKKTTFKRAMNVKVGDQLVLIDKVEVFGNKSMWNPRFIGMMIGDGNITVNGSPNIGSCDKGVQDYIERTFEYSVTKTFQTKDGREYKNYTIRKIIPYLKESGIYGLVKDKKRLPRNISEYDRESLAELIGGYFDTDGNVKYHKKRGFSIVLTSAVIELLTDVKFQLTKFGIGSTIVKEYRSENNSGYGSKDHIYRLYISKTKSVNLFRENIKFLCEHKQNALNIIDIKRNGRMSSEKYAFELNEENNKGECYVGMKFISGLRYETVTNIEFIGEQNIYNLTADTTHTYLANNFVTGNTGGNMNKGSKDFEEFFVEAKKGNNDFYPFEILAPRFHKPFYGGCSIQEPVIPNLIKDNKEYELLGVEDLKAATDSLIKEREEILKSKDPERYQEHLKDYPMSTEDIFRKTIRNVFETEIMQKQAYAISSLQNNMYFKVKFELKKNDKGEIITPEELELVMQLDSVPEEECVLIHKDYLNPDFSFQNLFCAGIDSYDQDKAKSSKSKGAMVVLARRSPIQGAIQRGPVAIVFCRPHRKEIFYEMCLRTAIFFRLNQSVLIDLANKLIFKYFQERGYSNLLAYRPRKFEKEDSQQTELYGFQINNHSKQLMVGLMQSAVNEDCDQIWFGELINQLQNYDEVEIGSDNDLADAYGIALVQDVSEEVKARNIKDYTDKNVFQTVEWITDSNGNKVPLEHDNVKELFKLKEPHNTHERFLRI